MADRSERGTTAPVGVAAQQALGLLTIETDSSGLATVASRRLDDQQIAEMRVAAAQPVPVLPACEDLHFDRAMRSLSTLPRRADDELTGDLRLELYRWKLGGFSQGAINHLVSRALETCRWFPSPAECLVILQERNGPVERAQAAKASAAAAIRLEMQARLADWMDRLRRGEASQDEIDGVSERHRRIAETAGLLRWDEAAGCHRLRAPLDEQQEAA